MSILPDTDSVVQVIKRVHYQASKWYKSELQTIHDVTFEGNGWIWCEDDALVKPVWFTGEQLPKSLNRENDYGGKQVTMKVLQSMNIQQHGNHVVQTEEAKR